MTCRLPERRLTTASDTVLGIRGSAAQGARQSEKGAIAAGGRKRVSAADGLTLSPLSGELDALHCIQLP